MAYRDTAINNDEVRIRGSLLIRGNNDQYGKYIKLEKPRNKNTIDCYYFNEKAFMSYLNKKLKTYKVSLMVDDDDFQDIIEEHFDSILETAIQSLEYEVESLESNSSRNSKVASKYSSKGTNCHHRIIGGGCHHISIGCHGA